MSGDFFRTRNEYWLADSGRPQLPVEVHEGHYSDFLRRFEHRAANAAAQGIKGIAKLGPSMLKWIADPRNIRVAADVVVANGGVPGPDGLDCRQLSNSEKWELARTLKQCQLDGTFRHGPTRRIRIKKLSGSGYRTIEIESHIDRIVARAVLQILQPAMDPRFHELSFGFRPGRDRRHALKAALDCLKDGKRYWVVADLQDAFDNIPLNRLMDIVRRQFPKIDNTLLDLIKRMVGTGKKRGIRQGNPLSPFLMNIYLDHHLDGVWEKHSPDEPLLRTADDLLVCCRAEKRAHRALDKLQQILDPTGMRLNQKKSAVHKLHTEVDTVDWLGYVISWKEKKPCVRIAEPAWGSLRSKWEEAHRKESSPIRAMQILEGWLDQLGPCLPEEDTRGVYQRAVLTAETLAFDEQPELEEFQDRWRASYVRWCDLCGGMDGLEGRSSGGSARHVFSSATRVRRSDGASPSAPSLSFDPQEEVTLYTDGAYDRLTSRGGWAAILVAPSLPNPLRGSGTLRQATNNRAELIAVIRGLERLKTPTRITLISDSRYVIKGISEWLPGWKAQGWRAGSGRHKRPLQNFDLWKELDALMEPHSVQCEGVRGHSGHVWNEECDRLAVAAMERLTEKSSLESNTHPLIKQERG